MRGKGTAAAHTDTVETQWEVSPAACLRDPAGREALLQQVLSGLLMQSAGTQVWHGSRDMDDPAADAGLDLFTAELRRGARPRVTLIDPTRDPDSLDIETERADHVRLRDGRFIRVYALTVWPSTVALDWLDPAVRECAAVSLHLRPVPAALATRLLHRRLSTLTATALLDVRTGRLPDMPEQLATESVHALSEAVARGATRLLYAQVLFRLEAVEREDLEIATENLVENLAGLRAGARLLRFEQGPATAATRRGGSAMRWPWRLLDAASVAATLPHPVGPANCGAGILAGVDPRSGMPLRVDRWAAHNPARLVVGTSGTGKSFAAKLELLRQVRAGALAVVIDPEGEFGAAIEALGGVHLAVGVTPAGLDPVALACRSSVPAAEAIAVLVSWAGALLQAPLSALDVALLDSALTQLRVNRARPATPAALLTLLGECAHHDPFRGTDLPARLVPAVSGALAMLFAPNPALADPPNVVGFDLRAVTDRTRPAVLACILAWIWTRTIGAAHARRHLIVCDEAHLLLGDPAAAALLAQLARRARKYEVGLEVITQRLSDFLRGADGEAVLANVATKLLLGCEDRERAEVGAGLGLTPAETNLLRPGRRGAGLLLTAGGHRQVQVVADSSEARLASSGPRQ